MSELILRDVAPEVVEGLRKRAEHHGRSVEGEARAVLQESLGLSKRRAREAARRIREQFAGRTFSESAELIREDRDR
ncbi:MAG TPA: Arc family DNA-binding protein [Thermoanaerobaculia bacterium]|nr:Arc family DNA-binding protein [Thermoanaerobaculia bacterium]